MPAYIERMEQEFKENYERYSKGKAYLDKRIKEDQTPELSSGNTACCGSHPSIEIEMLQNQMYSMDSYLKTLGSRIMFAKAKEGLL